MDPPARTEHHTWGGSTGSPHFVVNRSPLIPVAIGPTGSTKEFREHFRQNKSEQLACFRVLQFACLFSLDDIQ